MNRLTALSVTAALISPFSVQAVELTPDLNLAIGIGAVSDYRSLGVSQTQGDPAIQLDTVLSHSSGAFLGLWSSSFDFGKSYKAYREDGYYAGYAHSFKDDINVSASIGRYEYPNQASFDTNEIYVVANIYKFRVGYIYDFDVKDTPNLESTFIGYNFNLPLESNLYAKYGHTDYNFDLVSGSGDTRQTYNDWEVTITKTLFGVDWNLTFVDTDLSDAECAWISGADDICSASIIVGAKRYF
ncbi:TorF family putative porin [Pseudomonas syringae group genomosp. 3]|uniref:TorF family putative porin n=1 Tax=Pseudomonas syringae group genomosp. 3 TaxID=251701 RepID=UPI000EFDC4FD|nr:TorF family putative porin [Pseudomonas syringae group genomosp. 3]